MTVYSSNTSLILTDLLTSGQNYSFAVAVTDNMDHGVISSWSHIIGIPFLCDFTIMSVNAVPGIVSFLVTNITVVWQV